MKFLSKIRQLITKVVFAFIDIEYINNLISRRNDENSRKMVRALAETKFYPGSIVHNFSEKVDSIWIGKNSHIKGELLVFKYGGEIQLGDNVFIGEGSRIWSGEKISIGSHTLISHNVFISDTSAHEINHIERSIGFLSILNYGHSANKGTVKTAAVVIEDSVWINPYSIVLKGVRIGEGAIVASGSVVTKDVAPFTMVAGNPALFVKNIEHDLQS